jgi:hypothetical protein
MGKHPPSPQNERVPRHVEQVSRLRPEEILARSFSTPFRHESNEGWSPRGRRFFLLAMALAGAMLVSAGLLVTGELGPGPSNPKPVETGPDASVLAGVLQNGTEPATPGAVPTTAAPSAKRGSVPVTTTPTASTTPSNSPPVTPDHTNSTTETTQPKPTTTTLPCSILGARAPSNQIPPICP